MSDTPDPIQPLITTLLKELGEDPAFAARVPTAENIALAIESELAPAIAAERPGARLHRVRLEETRKNSFETGEAR